MYSEHSGVHLLGKTQRFLLEISTILYFFARNAAIPLVQQYIYFLVAKKYNFTAVNNDELMNYLRKEDQTESLTSERPELAVNGSDLDIADAEVRSQLEQQQKQQRLLSHKVSEESSLIVLYLNIAELLPSAIVVIFLGCYSDATGRRKFMMWLPCVGSALYALGFLLPLYVSSGDIDSPVTKALFVVASLCSGLSGNVPGFLSGNASYISDTDSPRRRSLRLAIVEMSIGLTFGVSSLVNGYWVAATSHFEQPLWFIFACSLLPLVLIFFFLVEPAGEVSSQLGHDSSFRNFGGIRHVFGCKTIEQRKLWAIFFAFQIYVFVQQGQERTFVLFLQNHPLHWMPTQIGMFLFILYVLSGFGSWPGVPLLQRIMSDLSIAAIALLSKLIGSLLLAVAQGSFVVYLSSVVQVFHLIPYAIGRSLASQQMGEDEQGSVYALLHSVQALLSFFGPVVHNSIFAATLSSMSGTVFLVSGPLLLVPLVLLGYTGYLEMKDGGYWTVGGSQAKPFSPSSLTPLSETSGFVQRSPDFHEDYHEE